jgi:co-chaperonin GroES (HSP10)
VVAVGPDFAEELDVGAKIVYSRWLTEVEVGNARYLLIRGEDVLAVLA